MKLTFWKKSEQFPHEVGIGSKSEGKPVIFKIIFGIVVLGLLINFVLLYLLQGKVTILNEDKAIIAETINRASGIMDKNSGTVYSKELTAEALTNKESFQNVLPALTKQATALIKERDALAKTLSLISASIDSTNLQKESALSDINSYESSAKAVVDLNKKLLDANGRLATFIADLAESLQSPIPDRNSFILNSKITVNQAILKSISDSVAKSNQQISDLKEEATKKDSAIADLNKSIRNATGTSEDFKKLFNEQRKELEQVKVEYETLKTQIGQSNNSASDENGEEIEASNSSSNKSALPQNVVRNVFPEYYYKLTGTIVDYNSKWGFVIVNFGSDSKMTLDIDGIQREVTVPAPLGQELYIARGNSL